MPATNVFNAQCYLSRYPDLRGNKSASSDPYQHWIKWGQGEGRVPGCDVAGTLYSTVFDPAAYLARYPDIRQSAKFKGDPFSHWQIFGIQESRHPGYELIIPGVTPPLTAGVVSPGTVQIQDSTAVANTANNGVITAKDVNTLLNDPTNALLPNAGTQTATTPATTPATTTGINKNYIYIAGGAVVLLLLMKNNKKSKRKK